MVETLEKDNWTVSDDYNRTEVSQKILNDARGKCVDPDFVLINTNQDVADEQPYLWDQEVLKIRESVGENLTAFNDIKRNMN